MWLEPTSFFILQAQLFEDVFNMTIRTKTVDEGARFLADRYLSAKPGQRLADSLRPETLEEALAMQERRTVLLNRDVGGWKCLTPQPDGLIVAPIFRPTIQGGSTCPIVLDKQRCRIEPELAFTVTEDLSPHSPPYLSLIHISEPTRPY